MNRKRICASVFGAVATVVGLWGLGVFGQQDAPRIVSPEALLPADALAYVRWDGTDRHREAWEKTAAYAVIFKTSLGRFFESAIDQGIAAIGRAAGDINAETIARQGVRLLDHVGHRGVVAALSVRSFEPFNWQLTAVFPNAAKAPAGEDLQKVLAFTLSQSKRQPEHQDRDGRAITTASLEESVTIAWWAEGEHLVLTVGSEGAEAVLEVVAGRRPSIAGTPLLKRYGRGEGFEQAAVGWLDVKRLLELLGKLPPDKAGRVPAIIAALGLDGVEAVAAQWGLNGKRLETVVTVEAPAPRRGVVKLLDQKPFTLDQLPPLPSSGMFDSFSLDPAAAYDDILAAVERLVQIADPNSAAQVQPFLAQAQALLGFDPRADLLAHLGHIWAIYSEGEVPWWTSVVMLGAQGAMAAAGQNAAALGMLGSMPGMGADGLNAAVAVEVKDAAAVRKTLAKLDDALKALAQGRLRISERQLEGTSLKSYQLPGPLTFLTPTVAVTDRWLVIGTSAQPVQGLVLRQAGKLPAWKPSAEIREALAGLPEQLTSFVASDPRPGIRSTVAGVPFLINLANAKVPGLNLDAALIPTAEEITKHLVPNVSVSVVDARSIRWINRSSVPSLEGGLGTTGILTALLLPAVQAAREAARRTESANNLRQLAIAAHTYHDVHKSFPPGTLPNAALAPEKRLSWMVELLPFLEQQAAYQRIDRTKAWDDPANKEGASAVVRQFLNPSMGGPQQQNGYGVTHYVGLAGLGKDAPTLDAKNPRAGMFGYDRRVTLADIRDGTTHTILALEVRQKIGPWAAGGPSTVRGFTEAPYINGPDGFGGEHPTGLNAAFADGSVRFLQESVDPEVLKAYATIAGGEPIGQ